METQTKVRIASVENPTGMFAVFRRRSGGTKAHFTVLHDTLEKAQNESLRLALEIGEDCRIYVAEVRSMAGMRDGKIIAKTFAKTG